MKTALQRWAIVVFALLLAEVSIANTTAFVNVNVVSMSSGSVIAAQTVLVEDDIIVAIGSVDDVRIPKGAIAIDGTDRYLMPGLGEMHAHVPDADSSELDRYFTLFVANGITTVRGMLGRPSHLALRQRLLDGTLFGPRLIASGPSLNGRSVAGPADARRQVREQAALGYDFIKVHPGLSAAEFTALAETANELGIPFAGHVPVAAGVATALRLKMRAIDHLDGYFVALLPPDSHRSGGYGGFFDVMLADELEVERIGEMVSATAAAGTWNVPTQVLVEQLVSTVPVEDLRNRPEMKYMPKRTVQDWAAAKEAQIAERGFDAGTAALAIELRRRLIFALHDSGARLLLGSDAPQIFNVPGFSAHRELEALVASGLTPFEALQTGTAAVAEFLGTNAGHVQAGKDADLVLLDANPLEDIQNSRRIHGVMLRGVWLPGKTLEERLEKFDDDAG
ncbi:MAG: amidohydrolase family protein [Gammaproteobacteria bacterium]|nr:amidohydrolase family protein [Gammaproteobacteria bacterium]MBT8111368.1 amidohydrolase family protein [Gammaproteobacteria bacterium]NNL46066.1 amidohydrolase family protein [Woeseiaceae bacterium]